MFSQTGNLFLSSSSHLKSLNLGLGFGHNNLLALLMLLLPVASPIQGVCFCPQPPSKNVNVRSSGGGGR